jgi:hypothetical protein
VLTTRRFYDRLPGFDSRNVAVNRLKTPSPAITFPITAIMYFLNWQQRRDMLACSKVIFAAPGGRVQQTVQLPNRGGPAHPGMAFEGGPVIWFALRRG